MPKIKRKFMNTNKKVSELVKDLQKIEKEAKKIGLEMTNLYLIYKDYKAKEKGNEMGSMGGARG